jgi:hypothetical protein
MIKLTKRLLWGGVEAIEANKTSLLTLVLITARYRGKTSLSTKNSYKKELFTDTANKP